jgi:hypothetical protein
VKHSSAPKTLRSTPEDFFYLEVESSIETRTAMNRRAIFTKPAKAD